MGDHTHLHKFDAAVEAKAIMKASVSARRHRGTPPPIPPRVPLQLKLPTSIGGSVHSHGNLDN